MPWIPDFFHGICRRLLIPEDTAPCMDRFYRLASDLLLFDMPMSLFLAFCLTPLGMEIIPGQPFYGYRTSVLSFRAWWVSGFR